MNRTQQILGGLLIVQIIISVILFWPQPAAESGEPLFSELNADQIVAFAVEDDSGKTIGFERVEDGWVISGTDGYPANAQKIDPLLEGIVEIKTGRLVASKAESYTRLQVGDDDFARRFWFKDSSGNENILYIGSSAGAAATHVRKAGMDEVFLTDKVSSWQISTATNSWADVVYVSIPREQMQSMTLENPNGFFEFVNEGTAEEDNWVMLSLGEGEEFNSNNLVSMLTRLTNLQMNKPLGTQELPEYGLAEPTAVVTLEHTDEEGNPQTLVLRIGALDPVDNNYHIHASSSEYYVKIPKYSMQDFVERSKEAFLVTEEAGETEGSAE
ncbi:MAG: DUF4340 domain-containing protein [Anaerolineales bacterium]|nr:DUF4340 domain-containing protein [Anaerolineales bacterium]